MSGSKKKEKKTSKVVRLVWHGKSEMIDHIGAIQIININMFVDHTQTAHLQWQPLSQEFHNFFDVILV